MEFLGYQFSFGERDFEERVAAAAVKLGLVPTNDLEGDEVADLVELAADARKLVLVEEAEPHAARG